MNRLIPLFLAAALSPAVVGATTIVNDSWADGGRSNGADALDTSWWTSTASNAIEVGVGTLGLVSGGSGRGIHGTFAAQTLAVGDSLTARFTFTTPATVGSNKSDALRAGLFKSPGASNLLAADLTASSGTPNALYNNVTGYATLLDVNLTGGGENLVISQRSNASSGQLLATTADYTALGSGGAAYTFAANTSYTGVFALTRTGAASMSLSTSLYQGASLLSSHTATDTSGIVSSFDVLAFQVGSATFGSSSSVGVVNNGIDFTNIKIDYVAAPVPEPASLALMVAGLLAVGQVARRRS